MLKIVVVEDEEIALKLMKKAIAIEGQAEIVGAFSLPTEALKYVHELKPDVVFLDVEMPEMNGIELAERLIKQNEDLQIVFVTAHNEYALEAFKVNALNYIMKPFNIEEISRTLTRIAKYKGIPSNANSKNKIQIKCFGCFEILNAYGVRVKWASKKSEELLAYFILNRGKQIHKWKIGDDLWPEANEHQLDSNFHTSLFRLRKTLTEENIPIKIESEKGGKDGYCCHVGDLDCDLIQLEEFVVKDLSISEVTIKEFENMQDSFKGELYTGLNSIWYLAYRETVTKYMIKILSQMADFYIQEKNYEKALKVLKRGLELEPYEERVHQSIMKVYFYEKDKCALELHYKKLKAILKSELNTELDSITKKLYVKYLESIQSN